MEITARVRQSSHPNQGAEQAKTARHVVLDAPLTGRMKREAGDALCRPAVDFYELGREDLDTDATCKKCLERAGRYGVRIIKASATAPAVEAAAEQDNTPKRVGDKTTYTTRHPETDELLTATRSGRPVRWFTWADFGQGLKHLGYSSAESYKAAVRAPRSTNPYGKRYEATPAALVNEPAEDPTIEEAEAQQAAALVTEAEASEGTWRGTWIGEQPAADTLFTIERDAEQGALFDDHAAEQDPEPNTRMMQRMAGGWTPAPLPHRNSLVIPGALADHLAAAEIINAKLADALAAGRRNRGRSLIITPKSTDVLNAISEHADAILDKPHMHTRAERVAARIWVNRAGHARKRHAEQPVARPFYARTLKATTRHIIKPDTRNRRTLCGHDVSLTDEYVSRGEVHRPEPSMILNLPPCEKCERGATIRGLTPETRAAE